MDPLILYLMENFDVEFQKYQKKQENRFQEYFSKNGIKKFKSLKMKDLSHVIGNTVNSHVEGPAIVKYENGTCYIGNMKNNQRSGFGYRSYTDPNLYYAGEYENDQKQGKGKLWNVKKQQWVFDGLWGFDKKNGYGELIRDEGKYEGNWVNDRMSGKGKMTWSNGNCYDGDFIEDIRTGNGTMMFNSGDVYKGEFLNGYFNGNGIYQWKKGEKYEGNFKNGLMNGKGRIFYDSNSSQIKSTMQSTASRNLEYELNRIDMEY